jgi:hypothetical protein
MINFSFMWLLFLQRWMSEAREQMAQVLVNKDLVEKKKTGLLDEETLCPGILERYSLSLLLLVAPPHPSF